MWYADPGGNTIEWAPTSVCHNGYGVRMSTCKRDETGTMTWTSPAESRTCCTTWSSGSRGLWQRYTVNGRGHTRRGLTLVAACSHTPQSMLAPYIVPRWLAVHCPYESKHLYKREWECIADHRVQLLELWNCMAATLSESTGWEGLAADTWADTLEDRDEFLTLY